ncbi:hypothetical protein A2U01_0090889, partial [Trifolium medium]|nr:hypothetical protein [Trifolium medium]
MGDVFPLADVHLFFVRRVGLCLKRRYLEPRAFLSRVASFPATSLQALGLTSF